MNRWQNFWQRMSPAGRLAAAYVAIIVAISLLFTASLYRLSSAQLEDSLRREYLRFRPLINLNADGSSGLIAPNGVTVSPDVVQYQTELRLGKRHLALELAYFNLVILVMASLASYQLAKRTLRPIEEALEAQTRFSGDASHELRTPLAAMQAEIEVALRNSKLSAADARKLLESNLEEVAKLNNLSEGLLRLARGTQLPFEAVDLDEVVRQAKDRLAKAAASRSVTVVQQGSGLAARGDAQTLVELVAILLDNAIKYGPSGGTVTVGQARQGRQAVITVADEGPGVAEADLPHIFERFYRAEASRSRETGGYGLGLSIAAKIVETHKGTVQAANSGQGAVFTVRLPLA